MALAARETDAITTGHGCDAVSTINAGTAEGNGANVYVEGLGLAATGDVIAPHTIPSGPVCVPHSATTGSGSGSVYVNGISANRKGDSADAGSITGSASTVWIGD